MITYCKLKTTFILAMVTLVTSAEPTVTDVVAKQRYPWNGLVDITCKVSGIEGTTNLLDLAVAAVMPDSGEVRGALHFWVVQNGVKLADCEVHTNGNYKLLWDAQADFGQVRCDNMVVRVTTVKGHAKVQLWEGGPYWATTNIGAENPEDYGCYFSWGATFCFKRENGKWVWDDGSSLSSAFVPFSPGNAPTTNISIDTLKSKGWITSDGVLAPVHDAAHVQWGGKWRMPTKQELSDLSRRCTWSWTTRNGVKGYCVYGKGDYSSSSIFIPCAGYGDRTSLYNAGSYGSCWSSVPCSDDSDKAWKLSFNSSGGGISYYDYRYHGISIRPVQGFSE